eukprot:699458-Rhodomonas_salina.2
MAGQEGGRARSDRPQPSTNPYRAMLCPVPSDAILLQLRYAVSGTELGYAATAALRAFEGRAGLVPESYLQPAHSAVT